jgi:hypothetical protein
VDFYENHNIDILVLNSNHVSQEVWKIHVGVHIKRIYKIKQSITENMQLFTEHILVQ